MHCLRQAKSSVLETTRKASSASRIKIPEGINPVRWDHRFTQLLSSPPPVRCVPTGPPLRQEASGSRSACAFPGILGLREAPACHAGKGPVIACRVHLVSNRKPLTLKPAWSVPRASTLKVLRAPNVNGVQSASNACEVNVRRQKTECEFFVYPRSLWARVLTPEFRLFFAP